MRSFFSLSFLLIFKLGIAQVNFSSISFDEALRRSQTEGKLVFLQFEAANCNQCNDVANKGFENKEVADKINQTFVCLKIDAEHPERSKVAGTYNMNKTEGFGSLFILSDGTVIHKFLKTTTFSKQYAEQIDIALTKAGESLKINELEKEYKKGNKSFGFLEVLLEKRRVLNLPTDSLLDEYIDVLPPDSLKSTNTLVFIARMTPLLNSKADKALRKDRVIFNKAWYTISLQMRVGINNAIIYRSMQKAIREKNESYALQVSSFAQGTNTNYTSGAKAYDKNMLRFYDAINDTTAYFRKAIAYYERYFLVVSIDSIRRADSINIHRLAMAAIKKDTVLPGNVVKRTALIPYAPIGQSFSSELNNGAYEFYKKTNNTYLLSVATEWAERALEFYKSPQVLDTYARLLYKLNQADKAVKTISEAIALQQKRGFPTKEYDIVLDKMKNKKPLD